ncbi:MAG: amidohydrolase [Gammaproteobacteria bacterium]|nr:amidohydrolase [Gammaproteobacteria bacterium]
MSTYTGPIFDSDEHVIEPFDCAAWNEYLPEKYKKDWNYRWVIQDNGQMVMYVGSKKIHVTEDFYTADHKVPPPGKLHEWLKAMKSGKENVDIREAMTPAMTDRDERVALLDGFGVEGTLLFPGNHVGTIGFLDDVDAAYAINRSYNQWFDETWGFNYKDRIFATPLISLDDVERACEEARWAIKRGARVILMPLGPVNGKSPADPAHDAYWSILNEAKVNVAFHVSEARYMHEHMRIWGDQPLQSRYRQTAFTWLHFYGERPLMETLSSFIFFNFFARFPNIKLISVENGAEWVPGLLTRMDKSRGMARNGHWPCGQLEQRPSKIFRENVFVVAYPEDDLAGIIAGAGGGEFLVMGSDWPHAEGVATPAQFADEACATLSQDQTRSIMYDNPRRFLAEV